MRITLHPSKPLVWWYNRKSQIDINPPYQRKGRLWSRTDKGYLIDSIINGFDIPKLYLADFTLGSSPLNTNKLPYAIIDGKQRFEAIFDFFAGTLTLNEDFILKSDPGARLGGMGLKDLRAGQYAYVADAFETETVDIMSVVSSNVEDIQELFVRLNRSKPLTGAEVRNAMAGKIPDLIRALASHPFFAENIRFSTARAGDYNAAAKILLFEYLQRPAATKKRDLDKFASGNDANHVEVELAARRAADVLTDMQGVFLPKDTLLSSAGHIPVYYWLIRNTTSEERPMLRDFLRFFEMTRKSIKSENEPDKEKKYPSIVDYEKYSRSINDATSHQRLYEILTLWRNEYLNV